MVLIKTEIEIAAPPSEVRKIFLDFQSYPSWHTAYIKSVSPLSEDASNAFSASQKLHCTLDIYTFDATITENSPEKFQWRGPPVQTVWGLHSWIFEASARTPGGTTFRQVEELSGALSFLMHPALMGKKIKLQFEGFNEDLKRRAESGAAGGAGSDNVASGDGEGEGE